MAVGKVCLLQPDWSERPLSETTPPQHWVILDSAEVPCDKTVVRLFQRRHDFAIRVDASELMASGVHGSEDALAHEACKRVGMRPKARLLIGGLGMGYTLAAALESLKPDATVVVAEIVPAVVKWNRGPIGHLAGFPLEDPRVEVQETDVAQLVREGNSSYDAILLDVDNGPRALTSAENGWLYSPAGLKAASNALTPSGVLAVWSAWPDPSFTARLRRIGFQVEEVKVRSRGSKGGRRHLLWMASRKD